MPQSENASNNEIQFTWGEKKIAGKKGVQFYSSFTYDGTEYFLYDCVYVYKEGEPEPYIGKLVTIWEQPTGNKRGLRRVKILWFFRPIEILNFLGDIACLKNEIFLATGEGKGLCNINPLDVVAGKCNVICTSKDVRNPQPSEEELKMADYIFYRTFDVGSCTISDKIEDNIARVEAKDLFIWKIALERSTVSRFGDKNGKTEEPRCTVGLPPRAVLIEGNNHSVEKAIRRLESEAGSDANRASLGTCDNRLFKKMRTADSATLPEDIQQDKAASSVCRLRISSDEGTEKASAVALKASDGEGKSGTVADSDGHGKGSLEMLKSDAKRAKPSDGSPKLASRDLSVEERKPTSETMVATRRPDSDISKFFTDQPWENRIQKAYEQGTLVLLDNLDTTYTSDEVEDIVYHAFNERCTARVIEKSTFSNPYHGQALVIFKAKDKADEAIKKLNKEVLMLPNGRPVTGSKATPRGSQKTFLLPGHLSIEKTKLQREEMRKAVATSHCSQPNTIEYEMAVDWMLLEEKSTRLWSELHREQGREVKVTSENLKTR